MNKIEVKEEIINIENDTEKQIENILDNDTKTIYNVGKNSLLIVYQYGININNIVEVNLNGENARVEFHYNMINYDSNSYQITVNHNCSYTESNIYNHGLNVFDHSLRFDINGIVRKESESCICNQENKIINLKDGHSTILPNLLIDNYDVISSHSAFIGKFQEELLFYLMSRGISRKTSNHLLMKGFLLDSNNSNSNSNSNLLKSFMKQIEKI